MATVRFTSGNFPVATIVISMLFVIGCEKNKVDQERLVTLQRFVEPGNYELVSGDLVEIAVPGDPEIGPVALEITLSGNEKSIRIEHPNVLVPPPYPIPATPDIQPKGPEVRAYLAAGSPGEVAVTVNPFFGDNRQKRMPKVFRFHVNEKH